MFSKDTYCCSCQYLSEAKKHEFFMDPGRTYFDYLCRKHKHNTSGNDRTCPDYVRRLTKDEQEEIEFRKAVEKGLWSEDGLTLLEEIQ